MSSLFNFHINTYMSQCSNEFMTSNHRWEKFAEYLHRRLEKAVEFLDNRELVFEAGEASELSRRFLGFADKEHHYPDEFHMIWEDLRDWSEQTVIISGRERDLATLPALPASFSI